MPLLHEPPSPPTLSHLSMLSQRPSLSSLSHTANSHWLSILHMVMYGRCCSVAQLCMTFCDPHGLQHARLPCPSLMSITHAQTHVHRVDDAIQPSHPLSHPFPHDPNQLLCGKMVKNYYAYNSVGQ